MGGWGATGDGSALRIAVVRPGFGLFAGKLSF